jgi:hypothetical protein
MSKQSHFFSVALCAGACPGLDPGWHEKRNEPKLETTTMKMQNKPQYSPIKPLYPVNPVNPVKNKNTKQSQT